MPVLFLMNTVVNFPRARFVFLETPINKNETQPAKYKFILPFSLLSIYKHV